MSSIPSSMQNDLLITMFAWYHGFHMYSTQVQNSCSFKILLTHKNTVGRQCKVKPMVNQNILVLVHTDIFVTPGYPFSSPKSYPSFPIRNNFYHQESSYSDHFPGVEGRISGQQKVEHIMTLGGASFKSSVPDNCQKSNLIHLTCIPNDLLFLLVS